LVVRVEGGEVVAEALREAEGFEGAHNEKVGHRGEGGSEVEEAQDGPKWKV
jgi:hypothetical protein